MTWWERGRQMKAIYSELEYSLDRHRPASVVANRSKEEVVSSPVQSIKSGYWVIYWNWKKKSSFVSTSRDADHTYIGSGYLFPSKHFFKLSIPSVVSIKKNNPTSYFFFKKIVSHPAQLDVTVRAFWWRVEENGGRGEGRSLTSVTEMCVVRSLQSLQCSIEQFYFVEIKNEKSSLTRVHSVGK